MPPDNIPLEQIEYRLFLVRSGSHAISVAREDGAMRLPRITILRWTRPAERLQQVIESAWRLHVIILDVIFQQDGLGPSAVVEILSPESLDGWAEVGLNEIAEVEMTRGEREIVKSILAGDKSAHCPFSRLGWIEEAMEWMRAEAGHSAAFTGEIRQYNASASFALIRFTKQDGPAWWLKATGDPNVHEFRVTKMLAELCPELLPRRIAGREDWNAWLMEDGGYPLDAWSLPALEQIVLSMATLQIRTVERGNAFLAAGAFDQRIATLRAHLEELFDYLDGAMAKQTSTKVPQIEKRRLREMASVLQDACCHMEELEIPDTLIHNDINSGNILFQGTQCVFIDWCEVGVGNPFFSFQYLSKLQPGGDDSWTSRLREVYRRSWRELLTESQIERAFALTPLLAIFSYLFGRGDWLHSAQREDPYVESHARSLARHMDRAALAPELMEALCR